MFVQFRAHYFRLVWYCFQVMKGLKNGGKVQLFNDEFNVVVIFLLKAQ
jgi:hypothetical protein